MAPVALVAGGRGFGGGAGGLLGGGTTGTVVSLNGDQLVIQTRAGNLTITLPAGVAIEKTTTGSLADIINGSTVSVASTTDSTGKRTATRIFILAARHRSSRWPARHGHRLIRGSPTAFPIWVRFVQHAGRGAPSSRGQPARYSHASRALSSVG